MAGFGRFPIENKGVLFLQSKLHTRPLVLMRVLLIHLCREPVGETHLSMQVSHEKSRTHLAWSCRETKLYFFPLFLIFCPPNFSTHLKKKNLTPKINKFPSSLYRGVFNILKITTTNHNTQ